MELAHLDSEASRFILNFQLIKIIRLEKYSFIRQKHDRDGWRGNLLHYPRVLFKNLHIFLPNKAYFPSLINWKKSHVFKKESWWKLNLSAIGRNLGVVWNIESNTNNLIINSLNIDCLHYEYCKIIKHTEVLRVLSNNQCL